MDLHFKKFLEGNVTGLNAPGRAGEKFWKSETPILNDNPQIEPDVKHHLKGVHLNPGHMVIAPFKPLTGKEFGIKVKKIPKPGQK